MLKELVLFGNLVLKELVSNMVLNDLSVTFIPTKVFKHSRKGKPFDNLYIDNIQIRNYALYHVFGNILPGQIDIKV